MLDPIAALSGGRLAKLVPGKPDGPRVVLVALDALTRPPPRRSPRHRLDCLLRPAVRDLPLPKTSEGRILASATTEPGGCRLHKNINLSAGRLWDLLVTRQ